MIRQEKPEILEGKILLGARTRVVRSFAVGAAAVALWGCGWLSADTPPAATQTEFEPGALKAGESSGGFAVLEPTARRLTTWSSDGELRDSLILESGEFLDNLCAFAVHGRKALACGLGSGRPTLSCGVIDLSSRSTVAQFAAVDWPAKAYPLVSGWALVPIAPTDRPSVVVVDEVGRQVRTLQIPESLWEWAQSEYQKPLAAIPRVASLGATIWIVPAGRYEFWRIHPEPVELTTLPEGLAVVGHKLTGRLALRTRQENLPIDPEERQVALDALRRAEAHADSARSFEAAVVDVGVFGDIMAVVVQAFPELEDGRCRLDLWRLPQLEVIQSIQLAGKIPRLVALTATGAWLSAEGRLRFQPIDSAGR